MANQNDNRCTATYRAQGIPGRRSQRRVGDLHVAVFGGGVAGLTAAAALHVRGRPCQIYERRQVGGAAGMGIVLAAEALADLAGAGLDPAGSGAPLASLGVELHRFRSYHPDGALRHAQDIPPRWRGALRSELIDALRQRLPGDAVAHDAELAELSLDPEGTVADARLAGGDAVRADLYLAADGAHSLARRTLYPDWPQPRARVRELVGMAQCPRVSEWARNDLHKFQATGVAIGILPVATDTVGWFIQFDSERFKPPPDTPAARLEFARALVGTWADPIPELLRTTDFSLTHVWHPIDSDLVPRFHAGNLVLVGDAAHPLLPFTSQGVGAAISGARDLAAALDRTESRAEALSVYSAACRSRCSPFVARGRELTQAFLAEGSRAAGMLPLAVQGTTGSR